MVRNIINVILAVLASAAAAGVLVLLTLWKPLKGTPSPEIWRPERRLEAGDIPELSMADGEEFRILVVADLQLGLWPWETRKTGKILESLVTETDPHLIITVGDNTSMFFDHRHVRRIVRWMESSGRPWSVTLGNHDGEGWGDRYWLGNRYEEGGNSLFRSGPGNIHGVGNHGINIVDSSGGRVCSLILMDSNAYRRYPEGRDYDYIYEDQIQWYRWMVEEQDRLYGDPAPSKLFFHIPLPEFDEARQAWESGDADGTGVMREAVFCPPVNSGLFDAVSGLGRTTHIFNGHDHVNNLSVMWQGVRMTYVMKTGPGSYSDKDLQGGTLITLAAGTGEAGVEQVFHR